jgi:hypothetical protein
VAAIDGEYFNVNLDDGVLRLRERRLGRIERKVSAEQTIFYDIRRTAGRKVPTRLAIRALVGVVIICFYLGLALQQSRRTFE